MTCTVLPGATEMDVVRTACDPASVIGTDEEMRRAFRDAATVLRKRIELFVALPTASLDRMALQRQLDDIGRQG